MLHLILSLFLSSASAETGYSCDSKYGELGIPYVKTASELEMYYCIGLHHGQDRAWQMDFFRRIAQGRNAEIYGFSHLKTDLMMRLLDLPSEALSLYKKLPEDSQAILKVYSRGVNKGFEEGKKVQEFADQDFSPDPWTPEDSLTVLLLQAFDQTRKTFQRDYDEELLKEKFGTKAQELFDEDKMPWENTILKEGEYTKVSRNNKTTYIKSDWPKLWGEFPEVFGKESGSNNWVISRKKSKTGHAILANDPHLDLRTPMFWYWISLKSPSHQIIGASVPGVPVIVSGTNGKVSWGLTNSYLNAADVAFVNDLESAQIESFRPLVWVKFGFLKLPFLFKSFEKLKSGHRVLPLDSKTDKKIILRWTGFNLTADDLTSMFEFHKSTDVGEMNEKLSRVGVPSWNLVFADNRGDIGFRMIGKTYRHREKLPMGIPEMSFKEFSEEEYLKSEERPHVLKPSRNYVYTANNRHWPSDAEFYGGRGYSYSFRGFRIDEMLNGKHDIESFKNIQCDRQTVDARFFLSKLNSVITAPEFDSWDMNGGESSLMLPLYRRFMDLIFENWEVNEYALYKMLDQLNETQKKELQSFFDVAKKEVNGRTWGEVLKISFSHMSKNTDWKFSPQISGFGDTHTVDPGTARWNPKTKHYEQSSGASMRMIIEMSKEPKILLVLPGLNRDYQNSPDNSAWDNWKNCQYTEIKSF